MEDKGPIRSIKFSPDNKILAVQRNESSIEFVGFSKNQPKSVESTLVYRGKHLLIGFVWIHSCEVAIISNIGVETFTINIEKNQMKTVKVISNTVCWFSWCLNVNLAILASNDGQILTPFILKQGIITKLPKVDCELIYGSF